MTCKVGSVADMYPASDWELLGSRALKGSAHAHLIKFTVFTTLVFHIQVHCVRLDAAVPPVFPAPAPLMPPRSVRHLLRRSPWRPAWRSSRTMPSAASRQLRHSAQPSPGIKFTVFTTLVPYRRVGPTSTSLRATVGGRCRLRKCPLSRRASHGRKSPSGHGEPVRRGRRRVTRRAVAQRRSRIAA